MNIENDKRISKDSIEKMLATSNKHYWNYEHWKVRCRLVNIVDDDVLVEVLKENKGRRRFRRKHGDQWNLLSVMADASYYYFAQYIPTDCTVIDLGCGNNSQAYFFDRHRFELLAKLRNTSANQGHLPEEDHLYGMHIGDDMTQKSWKKDITETGDRIWALDAPTKSKLT